MVHYNPEISLGTIVEIVSVCLAVVAATIKFGRLEQKVNIMYHWFNKTVIEHDSRDDTRSKRFFGASEAD